MKKTSSFIIAFLFSQFALAQYQFVSPVPDSKNLPVEHNIIIRPGASKLDPSSVRTSLFNIQGSKSGSHAFTMVLCGDGKTINLNPRIPFAFDETVSVSISKGLITMEGSMIESYSFSFTTRREWTVEDQRLIQKDRLLLQQEETNEVEDAGDTRTIDGMFTIIANTNPSPGYIFFDSRLALYGNSEYNAISVIDNNGDSIYQRTFNTLPFDFQMGRNGYLETYQNNIAKFLVMDSNFAVIDTYAAVNGYITDVHELQMMPDGYAYLIADEDDTMMVQVNDSTFLQKAVQGSVIQKFDPDHNIVFEWRSFDHVAVDEDEHINYNAALIDYIHTNSIEEDTDGNIIASHRNIDQVTKIDVNTGEFIWRLGGVNNEFTFTNDANMFSHQHDCRRLANGNITLYDDGNYHASPKSYAKEYQLDEVNMTATLVWSYSHADVNGHVAFYSAMGNVQRLPNGNTLIGWGMRTSISLPSITEVDSAGNIVWELKLQSANNLIAYRAHRYVWEPCARPTFNFLNTADITNQSAKVMWASVTNPSQQYEVQYKRHVDTLWLDVNVDASQQFLDLTGLEPNTEYDWRIQSWCDTVAGESSHFTDVVNFTTLLPTSVNEVAWHDVDLYPNPADEMVTIISTFKISKIRVMDLLGQEVKNIFVNEATDQPIEISVSDLSAGNYFVEVISDEKNEVRKLVVE